MNNKSIGKIKETLKRNKYQCFLDLIDVLASILCSFYDESSGISILDRSATVVASKMKRFKLGSIH